MASQLERGPGDSLRDRVDRVPRWRHSLETRLRVNRGGEHVTEGCTRVKCVTED